MAQFAVDAFGGTSGTLLPAYNAAWSSILGSNLATISPAGRVWQNGGTSIVYQHSGTPASADYTVAADFFYAGSMTTFPGIAGRITASDTMYFVRYETSPQVFVLHKVVSGTTTVLATSSTSTFGVGDTMRVALEMIGTAIKVYRDGVQILSVTDGSITAAGKAGIRMATGAASSASGVHLDNFSADDGALPDTTAPTLTSPTATPTGQTTATGTVSTNEANGTLYWLASANASESGATVKAGSSQAVSGTGSQGVSVTGLTASTAYYLHYLHTDAATNDSTVSSSAQFTTFSASGTVTVTDPLKNNTGTVLASESGVKVAVLAAATLASVFEGTETTDASGMLSAISDAAIGTGQSYHVAIKLADGSVGITGPITAS